MTDISRDALEIADERVGDLTDIYDRYENMRRIAFALRDALDETGAENITLREELYRTASENYELTDHIQGSRKSSNISNLSPSPTNHKRT